MNKPHYYAVIPAKVRYAKGITPNAKLLYAEITALCNMNGRCNASTKYFCNLYEVSRSSIQNWLKSLEDNNFIIRDVKYKQGSREIESRYIKLVDNPKLKISTDNTNINITNTNLTDSNKKALFKKPTLDDVKNYCILRNNNIDAEAFIDFYESKNFMIGKNKMKDWKACVRTWERRDDKRQTMSKLDSQLSQYEQAKKLL